MKKFLNFFLHFVLPVIIISIVFWYGWGDKIFLGTKTLSLKEELIFKAGPYDLGVLSNSGGVVSRSFHIYNKNGEGIYLSKVYTDCNCLSVVLLGFEKQDQFSLPEEEYGRPVGVVADKDEQLEFRVFFSPSLVEKGNFVGNVFFEAKNHNDSLRLNFKSTII